MGAVFGPGAACSTDRSGAQSDPPVRIDGSLLEGGGQILRLSVSLAALLGRPIRIERIRAGRSTPGLRAQHLHGIRLVARMCGGILEPPTLDVGATELTFVPGQSLLSSSSSAAAAAAPGSFVADTQTAGSVCLLMQVALPCMLFFGAAPCTCVFRGGTNAAMAPQIDYLLRVFQPIVERTCGARFQVDIERRGYFPKGGGQVVARTPGAQPLPLSPIVLTERGAVTRVHCRAFAAGPVPLRVAEQMATAACASVRAYLEGDSDGAAGSVQFEVDAVHEGKGSGAGSGLIIVAHTARGCILAGSALGDRRTKPDRTGAAAGDELVANLRHGGCVDEYLQDQLIVFMALAAGRSTVRSGPLSLHTRTAIHFATLLSGATFNVEPVNGSDSFLISCEGIGLEG